MSGCSCPERTYDQNEAVHQIGKDLKMQIISDTTDFRIGEGTAVAIGKFDGLHLGHRKLLSEIL